MTTEIKTVDLGNVDCERAKRVWVKQGEALWVYDPSGATESHDPMDRVGGPFRINDLIDDGGDRWYLFAVVDCYFPLQDLVKADSFEEAYEAYIDWAADHRHIKIVDEDELRDYKVDTDDPTCGFTSDGTPVDTDNVNGSEVQLSRIDF